MYHHGPCDGPFIENFLAIIFEYGPAKSWMDGGDSGGTDGTLLYRGEYVDTEILIVVSVVSGNERTKEGRGVSSKNHA